MTLTDDMRRWLNTPERRALRTYDFTLDFLRVFRLTPTEAGILLAQWSREVWRAL